MCRENGDKLLHFELGFNVPYKTWYTQGMPGHVQALDWASCTEQENLYDHFNVSGFMFYRFNQFCYPTYEEKIISEHDGTITKVNKHGNIVVNISEKNLDRRGDGTNIGSPPHEIDFIIKTPRDYDECRHLFVGNIKGRTDWDWLKRNGDAFREQQDYLSAPFIHGPFAFLREIVGTENAMILPYEEPAMIRMMLNDHLQTVKAVLEPVIRKYRPDMAFIWEDCCGSTGPFIAPPIFDELFAWWYREMKDYCSAMGVRWLMLDTDGDPSPLVTRWYGSGIDCMHPWEVNAVDMLKFADEFPQYTLMGGIYKHMFEPNDPTQVGRFTTTNVHEAIRFEMERVLKPMRKRGNYIACLDHWAYWAVSYGDYRFYCDEMYKYGKGNVVSRMFSRG
jgi:uroporphyrinogen decarboxylase